MMQFGAQVSCYRIDWDDIRTVVETMEAGRWSSVWFADHFLPPPGRPEEEHLTAYEGYTITAAVAGFTERLRLGHLVLGNTYRNPALVAKMAATIDQISHGRFTLAIGAAWFKREHEAYGWTFPEMRERSDRLQEACELIRALFVGDGPVDFDGRYYKLDRAPLSPGCFQKPLPILIGGTGEKRTLRTLALHGDVFNLDGWAGGPMSVEYYQHKLDVLKRHCDKVGRDFGEIKRTILMPTMVTDDESAAAAFLANRRLGAGTLAGPKNYVIDCIGKFVEAGVDEIMFGGIPADDLEGYQRFDAEVLAAFD
ncbi:MAG: LLM class flavin-dependent oxidoreductase [Pseudomonadales bacterium]|jgi:alkanesulfonate monooxygenase SsuD/methylene tetrahydromethanopterin reductase-like flavin-dependent oxidoreductase (luciferase family)|nr:LLM class flavin-dependent oxidoreductase [Pseudomonadales bacterium]MDP7357720.1 LLM class flavin-dependent oxidoreductase [Pseudomonadales bacterium]|tara:strand:- start:3052 stop:3981 length:930 start_codon:yes stop_codon:yes gene_type:complete